MIYLLAILFFFSPTQAFSMPEWIKKIPVQSKECEYVVGEGRSTGNRELDIFLASKRSINDGHVKILKKMDLTDFEHEVKLNRSSEWSNLEETSVENFPRIGTQGIVIQETFKENSSEGIVVYSLICFERTKIQVLDNHSIDEKRPVRIEIDSVPSAPEVVINGKVLATPAIVTLIEGERVLIRFRYNKEGNQYFEYTAKIQDDMKRKFFQLDISTQADKHELELNEEATTNRKWIEGRKTSDEHRGINWGFEYALLSKTLTEGSSNSGFGFSLRYEFIKNLELGVGISKGGSQKQGDGITKYDYFNYGPDLKINLPYGWSAFENKSLINPYFRFQYMFWNQSVTQIGTFTSETTKSFKAQSGNYSLGFQIGRPDGSFKLFSEFQRIHFISGNGDFKQQNSNSIILGIGGEF